MPLTDFLFTALDFPFLVELQLISIHRFWDSEPRCGNTKLLIGIANNEVSCSKLSGHIRGVAHAGVHLEVDALVTYS